MRDWDYDRWRSAGCKVQLRMHLIGPSSRTDLAMDTSLAEPPPVGTRVWIEDTAEERPDKDCLVVGDLSLSVLGGEAFWVACLVYREEDVADIRYSSEKECSEDLSFYLEHGWKVLKR